MFSRDELTAITRDRPEPLYLQLAWLLQAKIERGDWQRSARVPGELDLMRCFGLGRVTARRALEWLRAEGWLERRAGVGSVVVRAPTTVPALRASVADLQEDLYSGAETRLRLLECTRMEAPPAIRAALQLRAQTAVDRVERLRLQDDQPVAYYLSHTIPLGGGFNARLLTQGSRLDQLKAMGVLVAEVEQSFSASAADTRVAHHLEVRPGTPLLRVTRVVTDIHGRHVDHLLGLYRVDRFQYSHRLHLGARRPR